MTGMSVLPVVLATRLAAEAVLRSPKMSTPTELVPRALRKLPTLVGAGLSLPVEVRVQFPGAVLATPRLLVRH